MKRFVRKHMPNAPRIQREIVEREVAAGRTVAITGGRYDPFMTFMLWRDRGFKDGAPSIAAADPNAKRPTRG